LKDIIRRLHSGGSPEELKEAFREVFDGVNAVEIAEIEQELIEEGMPRAEVQRLCDLHIAVFKESLEKEETAAPPGHPVHILMEEHKALLDIAETLRKVFREVVDGEIWRRWRPA